MQASTDMATDEHDHDQDAHADAFLGAYILHMQENYLEAQLLFLEQSRT